MKFSASILALSLLYASAYAETLTAISTAELQTMQQQQAIVIDIRTEAEWQTTGIIPGSYKLQAFDSEGNFDQQTWVDHFKQIRQNTAQPVILVCRSGKRSEKLGRLLSEQLGMSAIYHLTGGIQGWTQSGQALNDNCSSTHC